MRNLSLFLLILFGSTPTFAINIQGTVDRYTGPQSLFGGVGHFYTGSGNCSAQPISASVLVTSAHCTGEQTVSKGKFSYDTNGDSIIEGVREVEKFIDHPGWKNDGRSSRPRSEYANDVALVFLKDPLPDSVPIYKLTNYDDIPLGSAVWLTGWGLQGVANMQRRNSNDGYIDRREATNVIDSVSAGGKLFQVDFDNKPQFQYDPPCNPNQKFDCLFSDPLDGSGYVEGIVNSGDSGGGVFSSNFFNTDYFNIEIDLIVQEKLTPPDRNPNVLIGINASTSFTGPGKSPAYGDVANFVFLGGDHRDWIFSQILGEISAVDEDIDINPDYFPKITSIDYGIEEFSFDIPNEPFNPNTVPIPSSIWLLGSTLIICFKNRLFGRCHPWQASI